MNTSLQNIFLFIFFVFAAGGAILIVERELGTEINNIPLKKPVVLDPQNAVSNILPKTEALEFIETVYEHIETEVPVPMPPEPIKAEPPLAQDEVTKEEPVAEVPFEETASNTTNISFADINTKTRDAVVNILCTTKSTGLFKPISGSGVIIHEHGVILTNAHIAQYFLLEDYQVPDFISCIIRTGSPARSAYRAELLHISSEWINENAGNIIEENPQGTGENDFAFLRITESTDENKVLPTTFPFIEVSIGDEFLTKNKNVLLAGYSAGFLGGATIQKNLHITSTVAQITEIYTFTTTNLDLFSVGGSILAQAGSSGGAVVDDRNKLLGIIVTSSGGETTDERDLRVLSLSHINRSLTQNSNTGISELLSSNIEEKARIFNEDNAPVLKKFLTDVLD